MLNNEPGRPPTSGSDGPVGWGDGPSMALGTRQQVGLAQDRRKPGRDELGLGQKYRPLGGPLGCGFLYIYI